MKSFDAIVEDVRDEMRVRRSVLADLYPCPRCHGECRGEVRVAVDDEADEDCPECGGTGMAEDAEAAASVDCWISDRLYYASTPLELALRKLLIEYIAYGTGLEVSETPPRSNPVVEPVSWDDAWEFGNSLWRDVLDVLGGDRGLAAVRMDQRFSVVLGRHANGEPLRHIIENERKEMEALRAEVGREQSRGESGTEVPASEPSC